MSGAASARSQGRLRRRAVIVRLCVGPGSGHERALEARGRDWVGSLILHVDEVGGHD